MRYTLEEIIKCCGVESEIILHFVSHEWIRPIDSEKKIFDEEDLARIQLIHELQVIMGVNDEAIPVVLHLIDQLNRLHIEIKTNTLELTDF